MVRRKKRLVKSGLQQCNESPSSSSPELGYQGEISSEKNHVVSSNCRVTPKKRGPRITVTNDEGILTYLEGKITDAFEIAFNSECETEGSRYASEILLAAYNKVEEQSIDSKAKFKTIFFEKFRYRLSFMVESLVSLDNRCRVLLFIAKFSINQWREGANDFINFLTDFCETLSHCDDPAVRQNVCTLVGFLLKEFGNRNSIGCGDDTISMDLRRKLYAVLVERQLDKVVAVRAEVVKSVTDIQDDEIPNDFVEAIERSPKDVILMGFRDVAAECRLAAVLGLHVVVIAHCDYLIELASSDPVVKVRVAAIRQLASLPLTFLTEEQRMSLLRAVIFDEDPSIRDAVRNVLLSEWLSFVQRLQEKRNKRKNGVRRMSCGQLRTMKPDMEEINCDEPPHMFSGLRDIKYGHGMGSAAQGLLSMLDFCDDSEAEDLCRTVFFSLFDVVRKILHLDMKSLTHFVSSLVNDKTFPEIVSCFSFKGTQVHIWALEASGIVALIAEEVARTVLLEALDAFRSSDESTKISSMDVVTDLILVYGFKEIRSWQHSYDHTDPEPIRSFISSLAKFVRSKTVPHQHSSTTGGEIMSGKVLRDIPVDSKVFKSNQLIMVAAFHELMSAIRKASGDDFVLRIDILGALHLLINTTHPSFLQQAPDIELGSVQAEFMRELLEYLLNHSDDTCVSLYWETASLFDLESFSSADLSEVKKIAQKILEDVIACTGLKSAMANEAHKLIRIIDCALHEIETREAEAKREDCLTELRDKTARSSRYGRRQTPMPTRATTPISSSLSTSLKRKKVTSSVKRSTQQLLNNERSPSPPTVLYTVVTPAARSRPQLSRTAKRIAVGKTRRWLFENDQ
uniref:Cnd3 domain-containing protein n=1 Tax=Angiostrongylus cantonensis TaxID=6313 RepID=A0A158P8T4_ANGCA